VAGARGAEAILIWLTIDNSLHTAMQQKHMIEEDFEVHLPSPIFYAVLCKQWASPEIPTLGSTQSGSNPDT